MTKIEIVEWLIIGLKIYAYPAIAMITVGIVTDNPQRSLFGVLWPVVGPIVLSREFDHLYMRMRHYQLKKECEKNINQRQKLNVNVVRNVPRTNFSEPGLSAFRVEKKDN